MVKGAGSLRVDLKGFAVPAALTAKTLRLDGIEHQLLIPLASATLQINGVLATSIGPQDPLTGKPIIELRFPRIFDANGRAIPYNDEITLLDAVGTSSGVLISIYQADAMPGPDRQ